MRRLLLAVVLAGTIVFSPSAAAEPAQVGPPRVCQGLTICAPVGGPWVVVPGPAHGASTGTAVWKLTCPPALGIVGGVDVRVANPWIDVYFPGRIGSPVNPGITTGNSVVFNAISFGPAGRPSSFLPTVGCIPAQGGQRVPTGVSGSSEYRPGAGLVRRVRTVEVHPGRVARTVFSCRPGEHLLSAETALGLYTALAPKPAEIESVRVTRLIRGGSIRLTAARHGLSTKVAAQVQIHLLCAERLG